MEFSPHPQHHMVSGPEYPLPDLSGEMDLDPLMVRGPQSAAEELAWLDTDL